MKSSMLLSFTALILGMHTSRVAQASFHKCTVTIDRSQAAKVLKTSDAEHAKLREVIGREKEREQRMRASAKKSLPRDMPQDMSRCGGGKGEGKKEREDLQTLRGKKGALPDNVQLKCYCTEDKGGQYKKYLEADMAERDAARQAQNAESGLPTGRPSRPLAEPTVVPSGTSVLPPSQTVQPDVAAVPFNQPGGNVDGLGHDIAPGTADRFCNGLNATLPRCRGR